ncbi:MAG: trifunctional glycosyltransferase/class I SAM-dependent methyltransferase/polysaccharide deacetylase [Ignavibacteriales bacterium]|nr:trifunctional glycosyltransferase/class I SAM-dependent methyltransferase/polysaccharide deacetylase [Ignavibacteriales bacterium]
MKVSIIIPAFNSAETISDTIKSVQAQTHKDWEAIVINDGSTDDTAKIVEKFIESDKRFRIVNGSHQGVGAARNTGIKHAKYDWLLFLDSDDWIANKHLELLTAKLKEDPKLDAVHSNWVRVATGGKIIHQKPFKETGDLFKTFARTCAITIHPCLFRKSLIEEVGCFDTSLNTCEDWDLWQKITRSGANFGFVDEVLAFYRMREFSASNDGFQMVKDALFVLERGHSEDPRVPNPKPEHKFGLPKKELTYRKYHSAFWGIGLALGNKKDPIPLLDLIGDEACPTIEPYGIAETLFESVPLPKCLMPEDWVQLLPEIENDLEKFLDALEIKSKATRLKLRVKQSLELIIAENIKFDKPVILGKTFWTSIEVTKKVMDLHLPHSVERLGCQVLYKGNIIGNIELPVFDNFVPADVLIDDIANKCSWDILRKYFSETIYKELFLIRNGNKLLIKRGSLVLGELNSKSETINWDEIHDHIGWTVFLQEAWHLPKYSSDDFYNPNLSLFNTKKIKLKDGLINIEISSALNDVQVSTRYLNVLVSVGGEKIGVVNIEAKHSKVSAGKIRTEITTKTGYELCKAVVKNTLIGSEFDDAGTLYNRLIASYEKRLKEKSISDSKNDSNINLQSFTLPEGSMIIGRRYPDSFGTSASRKAILPKSIYMELLNSSKVNNDFVLKNFNGKGPDKVIYNPEVINSSSLPSLIRKEENHQPVIDRTMIATHYDKDFFENLFSAAEDPWNYTSEYEQIKYEQTLSLVPKKIINSALEIACAEGHFTAQLAPRVMKLTAADFSQTALARTKSRCSFYSNISYLQLDISEDAIPEQYNLIICSEVLLFMKGKENLIAVAKKISAALKPGGTLIMANGNVAADEPNETGFNWDVPFGAKVIGETFSSINSIRKIKELKTPLYHIQQFMKKQKIDFGIFSKPNIIELPLQAKLTKEVYSQVLWKGKVVPDSIVKSKELNSSLPILMYHRISADGLVETSRYKITPDDFYEQMKYLFENGFYTISINEWGKAILNNKPLPGKAISLTFDDGFKDFYTYAAPILKEFGFSATVFLVVNCIGKTNKWDSHYGEEIELMNWDEIRELQIQGIQFGSHSLNHLPLTSVPPTEVVIEAIKSREILSRELGTQVDLFAYPYGDVNDSVKHIIGACGYLYAVSTEYTLSTLQDKLLSLPRIEIMGSDSIESFSEKLAAEFSIAQK